MHIRSIHLKKMRCELEADAEISPASNRGGVNFENKILQYDNADFKWHTQIY
jgi:hypothetical protein